MILSLQGGLGNQLFQWALARSLVAEGLDVSFDTVRCRSNRPLEIGPLIPGGSRVPRAAGLALVALDKAGLLDRHLPITKVTENGFGYDGTLRGRLRPGSYLRGYFQSPNYFSAHADVVKPAILDLLLGMLTPAGTALAAELAADPASVALHIRRGDYIANASAAAHHGILPLHYYREALNLLETEKPRRRIWFSDDLAWVKTNLAAPDDLLCPDGTTTAAGGEIALMAACGSRVIANSSFSWWAAYLGDEPSRRHPIIAPRQWFADAHDDAGHLVPTSWTRL